jgi:hypothetical protein
MAKKTVAKNPDKPRQKVHKELKDMDIRVNEFGEIVKAYDIDAINAFLKEKVTDKKLTEE